MTRADCIRELLAEYGLDAAGIIEKALKAVSRK